jgi:hypothetical protein
MSDLKELMTSNTSRDPNSEDFREQMMFAGVQAQTDRFTDEAGSLIKMELSHSARCHSSVFNWHIVQHDDMAAEMREKHILEALAEQERKFGEISITAHGPIMLSKATVSGLWLVARSLEKGVTAKVGIPFSLYRFCVQLLERRCLTEMEVRDLTVHHSVLLDIFQDEEGDGKNPGLSAQLTHCSPRCIGRRGRQRWFSHHQVSVRPDIRQTSILRRESPNSSVGS